MQKRFKDWQYPEIEDGKPTKYNWIVQHSDKLDLGYKTDIGAFSYINAKDGVVIEDDVQIGSHCSIYSVSTIDGKQGGVVLKKNCRIGTHSSIMPGVTIGKNSVIGAHSLVNSDIPDNCTAFGVPAKVVKKIVMTKRQRIYLSPPHLGEYELEFVKDAFASNFIAPLGPQVDAFEREFSEYTGIKYCVALSSGTAAIHLSLRELDVGPEDDVFGSTLTFIGSISPVIHLGANLTLIDCDRESWCMDPVLLSEALSEAEKNGKLPKAVIPTDLYGQCADYSRIFDICSQYDVPVVVDSAEAMGAFYKNKRKPDGGSIQIVHAGKGAKAAVFSFNGNKIITTSGGGMLASDDEGLIEHARFLSQQARDPFPYYEHSEIGYNYRMSNVIAGIGRGQLKVLDKRVHRKREIFEYYRTALQDTPGLEFMPEAGYGTCNRWLTVILITPEIFGSDCNKVRLALEEENIESRPVWKPMHLQPVFQDSGHLDKKKYAVKVIGGKVSEDFFNRGLCLPSGTGMTHNDLDRIIEIILNCRM